MLQSQVYGRVFDLCKSINENDITLEDGVDAVLNALLNC